MFSDYHYENLKKVRYYLGTVVYPVYYVANFPVTASSWVHERFVKRQQLLRENQYLKKDNLVLKSKLQKFAALKTENQRLKNLLNSSHEKIEGNAIVANLIATDYAPFRQRVIIDKGKRHQVHIGQPILVDKGVIGQIIEMTPFSATGMLISDPSHSMLAQVTRSGLRALVTGTGNPGKLRLDYVPFDADIREGDTLITSGLDNRYPPDFPIGKITRIAKSIGDNFANITVEPFARIDKHREVLLVLQTDNVRRQQ